MDKLLVKPAEACEALGICRSRMYELLATGELPSLRIGKSIRIPVNALKQWVDNRQNGECKDEQQQPISHV